MSGANALLCDPSLASCPVSDINEEELNDFPECYLPEENNPDPVFQSFPQGTQTFGPALARETAEGLSREFIRSLKNFRLTDEGIGRLSQLFTDQFDTTFQASLTLNETSFEISGPDISLAAGARIYIEGKTENGRVILTRPIMLKGVSVFGFDIREIFLNHDGKIEAQFASLPVEKDITAKVMATAFGKLFPGKKVGPVLTQKLLEMALGGDAFVGRGRDALQKISVNLQVLNQQGLETDNECIAPLLASAHVAMDVPLVRKNLDRHAYEGFDFSGIGPHSSVSWNDFPLSLLPLPDGIEHLEGTADVTWNYDSQTGTTTITAQNMDAQVLATSWFGEEPIKAHGGFNMRLKSGGEIGIDFNDFVFDLPVFPVIDRPLASIAGEVNGHVEFQSKNSQLFLNEAHLAVKDFKGVSKKGTGIRVTDQAAVAGAVEGDFFVDFTALNLETPLKTRWNMKGDFVGEAKGHPLQFQNAVFMGSGGWQNVGGGYYPDLGHFQAVAAGNLSVKNKTGWVRARNAWFDMHEPDQPGPIVSAAKIQMGSDQITMAGLKFTPMIDIILANRLTEEGYQMEGRGTWSARSMNPVVELGADFNFSADLDNYSWDADFTRDQIFGNLRGVGGMHLTGHGPMPYSTKTTAWELRTDHPYRIKLGNKNLAEGVRVTGTGGAGGQEISVDADSILDSFSATAYLRSPRGSSNLSGRFSAKANRSLVHQGFVIEDAVFEGDLLNGSLDKARVTVNGTGRGRLTGELEGPVALNYGASLRFAPGADGNHELVLELDPDTLNFLSAGPFYWGEENMYFQGNGKLNGTVVLNANRNNLNVTGNGLGFKNVEVRVQRPGSEYTPFLKDFSITVPTLRGIHGSVAYGGDEGIQVEGLIYPEALPYGIRPGTRPRHLYSVLDQLYLSRGTYWGNIRHFIRQFKKPGEEKKP